MRKTTTIVLTVAATAMAAPSTTSAATPAEHQHAMVRQHKIRDATRLARRVAHARGRTFSAHRYRVSLRGASIKHLARRIRTLRRALRPQVSPALAAIAGCESSGNPRAIGGGGAFRGKYQFSPSTWRAVGGSGDPAAASEAEQDRRAALLYARAGASPWPVCGR